MINDINDNLIENQIKGITLVEVSFKDGEKDTFTLYKICEDDELLYFIRPVFSRPKAISEQKYDDLHSQMDGWIIDDFNETFNLIETDLSYSEFCDTYYNNL